MKKQKENNQGTDSRELKQRNPTLTNKEKKKNNLATLQLPFMIFK